MQGAGIKGLAPLGFEACRLHKTPQASQHPQQHTPYPPGPARRRHSAQRPRACHARPQRPARHAPLLFPPHPARPAPQHSRQRPAGLPRPCCPTARSVPFAPTHLPRLAAPAHPPHLHTCIHAYMHAYIHTHIHTYTHACSPCAPATRARRTARHALVSACAPAQGGAGAGRCARCGLACGFRVQFCPGRCRALPALHTQSVHANGHVTRVSEQGASSGLCI